VAEGDLQKQLGANVRRIRDGLGLSQERFAERVGWHRTLVGAIERGERNLTLRTVERIGDQLGIDALDLLAPAPQVAEAPTLRAAARRRAGKRASVGKKPRVRRPLGGPG
jgi:transcriptional regulator with XRE-family HTH domain